MKETTVLKCKLHNAIVTDANLLYEGSITIDSEFMKKVGLNEWEKVLVINQSNAVRIETYVIRGEENSQTICLNGPSARQFQKGDKVIICAFHNVENSELEYYSPQILKFNGSNDNPVLL
ncbi:aspartate 1-decarboxylase [Catalinimonas alkaloidigena]|uniref:aspartate 1-decarboxylase n=1 Tax=Catalinimonas alkaloidigena TaxID=1075417 RepID=UPI002406C65F|nr:aspartate 1-decarboxylase [Catalinimonas alkaloidigena]MDF9799232.1 aspartate 1-decarboxylase [Catalinimonas alkaloidigena]